jgi:hypothetical protein
LLQRGRYLRWKPETGTRDCWVRYAAHARSRCDTKSHDQSKLLVGIHGWSKSHGDPVLVLTSCDHPLPRTYKACNEWTKNHYLFPPPLHWSLLTRTFEHHPSLETSFMRLPSSSSLILASLASSSSLSALAAPAGGCHEDSSSPAVPASLHSDDRAPAVTQSNSMSISCTDPLPLFSDTGIDYLESRDVLSEVSELLGKAFGLLGTGADNVLPKARDGLPGGLDGALKPITSIVSGIVPGGAAGEKTTRAEESEANGPAPDSPTAPGSSSPSPAAGAGPNGGAKSPAAPVPAAPVKKLPVTPALPVKPPVSLPGGVPAQAPADVPAQPAQPGDHPGRRDSNGAGLPFLGGLPDLSKVLPPPL